MRRVLMTKEEEQRILAAESKGTFDPDKVRVLIPTAGGPNALGAARLALGVARKSESPVTLLFVEAKLQWWDRVRSWFVRSPAGQGLDEHVSQVKKLAGDGKPPEVRRAVSDDVAVTIVGESEKGYDLLI